MRLFQIFPAATTLARAHIASLYSQACIIPSPLDAVPEMALLIRMQKQAPIRLGAVRVEIPALFTLGWSELVCYSFCLTVLLLAGSHSLFPLKHGFRFLDNDPTNHVQPYS